ncbi:MAG: hypothetical protein ACE37F_03930 [Nannocystaceae bacterium]|nr:hypothetical protein [bacterium]
MARVYEDFLGLWQLIPESCQYEQGDPPKAGTYRIEEMPDGTLEFTATWTDAEGKEGSVSFSGFPDGTKMPFNAGDLADALAIEAVSARELNSYAYLDGRELMVAQRQLDATGQAMRITQIVRLPSGESPGNVAIYRRAPLPS